MFATSKGPDQTPIEVNTETSFDFPGQWIWLKMNGLVLFGQSWNKERKKTKCLKMKLSCQRSCSAWRLWPSSQGSQQKGLFFASLLWPMLPHYWSSPPFFPLTMYTACIRTVHCFHFLSALGWLKMHNYHQFAALLWKVLKLLLGRKLCLCLWHAFAVPCPWYLYPPFPKWNISPLFRFTKKWVVCLFLWFVLDWFWRLRKEKKWGEKLIV